LAGSTQIVRACLKTRQKSEELPIPEKPINYGFLGYRRRMGLPLGGIADAIQMLGRWQRA